MLNQSLDPRYLQLFREYSNAIRAFEIATKKRKSIRAQFDKMRKATPIPRRPVGAPSNFTIPQGTKPAANQASRTRERKIYLGKILGWAKIIYTSAPSKDAPDPTAVFDTDKLYDDISLRLHWNAKNRYENAKRAYFDYVRRQNMQQHYGRAKVAINHAANLQVLGVEGAGESALDEARAEVEKACQNAWKIYQSSPSPKSDDVKVLLLENLAEAQLVGLDDSTVAKSMEGEIVRLINAGALGMVEK